MLCDGLLASGDNSESNPTGTSRVGGRVSVIGTIDIIRLSRPSPCSPSIFHPFPLLVPFRFGPSLLSVSRTHGTRPIQDADLAD